MAATFGSRPASVPAYTRQFQTLGPTASLLKVDTGKLPEVEPAGAIVPKIFEALGRMAGAAATAGEPAEEPASWQEQLADMPTDAEAMAQADPANRDLALNAALETAYGAGKDVQFGELAERIYAKNEADLDAFEADWQNLKTSALDNLAPSWKPIAEAEFDRRKALYVPRIAANIRTQAEGEANADLRKAADAYTARAAVAAHDDDAGDLAETLRRFEAAIAARTDLKPEEKAKARLDLQSGVATQVALGRFDRTLKDKGLEGAAQFAADFASGAAGGGDKLAEAERAPIARALKARLDDAREADAAAKAAAATQAKLESARRLTAVEKSIGENTYGFADLERDTQAGMFDGHPDAASRLSKSIAEARKARAAKTEAAARGAAAIAAGRDLTTDEAGQGAIDALWKAEKEAEPTLGAERAIEIAKRTRILPTEAREQIADALRFGTPKVQAAAARALDALTKAVPGVAGTLPLDVRKRAGVIAKALAQERDEETAAKIADDFLGPAAAGAAAEWEGLTPTLTLAADKDEEPPSSPKPGMEARPAGEIKPLDAAARAAATKDFLEKAGKVADPKDATDEAIREVGEALLRLVPGVGEALSARDAYEAFLAAREAVKDGDLAKALEEGTSAAINAVAAIPGLGMSVKLSKAGVKVARVAYRALRTQSLRPVFRLAKETGDHIREKLGKAARRLDEDATLLPLEPIAEMARLRFEEKRDGKEFKAEFESKDFGKTLSRDDAIQAFVEAERADGLRPSDQHVAQLNLGKVSPALAARVKEKTGEDIANMRYTIDTLQIGHAFGEHGPGNEKSEDQVPISPEAMSAYLDAVENFTDVDGPRRKSAGITLTFTKQINGVLFVVQQLRRDSGDFAFFNMWIKKNRKEKE